MRHIAAILVAPKRLFISSLPMTNLSQCIITQNIASKKYHNMITSLLLTSAYTLTCLYLYNFSIHFEIGGVGHFGRNWDYQYFLLFHGARKTLLIFASKASLKKRLWLFLHSDANTIKIHFFLVIERCLESSILNWYCALIHLFQKWKMTLSLSITSDFQRRREKLWEDVDQTLGM